MIVYYLGYLIIFYRLSPGYPPYAIYAFLLVTSEEFLASIYTTPASDSKSAIQLLLTFWSRGESQLMAGVRLTSKSHGSSFESIRMSNPKSSKQLVDLKGTNMSTALFTTCSTLIMVFIIISSILAKINESSMPNVLSLRRNALRLHFDPSSSFRASLFS